MTDEREAEGRGNPGRQSASLPAADDPADRRGDDRVARPVEPLGASAGGPESDLGVIATRRRPQWYRTKRRPRRQSGWRCDDAARPALPDRGGDPDRRRGALPAAGDPQATGTRRLPSSRWSRWRRSSAGSSCGGAGRCGRPWPVRRCRSGLGFAATTGDPRALSPRRNGWPIKRRFGALVLPLRADSGATPGDGALIVHARADGAAPAAGDRLRVRADRPPGRSPHRGDRPADRHSRAAGARFRRHSVRRDHPGHRHLVSAPSAGWSPDAW